MKNKYLNEGPKSEDEFVTWRQMATHYKNRCEILEAELAQIKGKKLTTPIEKVEKSGEVFQLPVGIQ